jgi:hypothetical protein
VVLLKPKDVLYRAAAEEAMKQRCGETEERKNLSAFGRISVYPLLHFLASPHFSNMEGRG